MTGPFPRSGDAPVHDEIDVSELPVTGEMDGWVLQRVQVPGGAATDLCVLDATDFESGSVARVHVPRLVSDGFLVSWNTGPTA